MLLPADTLNAVGLVFVGYVYSIQSNAHLFSDLLPNLHTSTGRGQQQQDPRAGMAAEDSTNGNGSGARGGGAGVLLEGEPKSGRTIALHPVRLPLGSILHPVGWMPPSMSMSTPP